MRWCSLVLILWSPVLIYGTDCTHESCSRIEGPICWGTKGDSFGSFTIPKSGVARGIRLIHTSGASACGAEPRYLPRHFGCKDTELDDEWIGIFVTDADNTVQWPVMEKTQSAFDVMPSQPDLTWYGTEATRKIADPEELEIIGPSRQLKAGNQLRIWYGEDLRNVFESDNDGGSCANVELLWEAPGDGACGTPLNNALSELGWSSTEITRLKEAVNLATSYGTAKDRSHQLVVKDMQKGEEHWDKMALELVRCMKSVWEGKEEPPIAPPPFVSKREFPSGIIDRLKSVAHDDDGSDGTAIAIIACLCVTVMVVASVAIYGCYRCKQIDLTQKQLAQVRIEPAAVAVAGVVAQDISQPTKPGTELLAK